MTPKVEKRKGTAVMTVKRRRKKLKLRISKAKLSSLVWKSTHKDYRAKLDGARAVLVLGPKGTTLKPLSKFSETELIEQLGKAKGF
jgi:hypothetical protein